MGIWVRMILSGLRIRTGGLKSAMGRLAENIFPSKVSRQSECRSPLPIAEPNTVSENIQAWVSGKTHEEA